MRYRILGPIEVASQDTAHAIGSPNQRLVLATLLANRNRVVGIDHLLDALWDDEPPTTALQTLRTYVSRLRRLVGDDVVAEGRGYRLAVVTGDVDADVFERGLDAASTQRPVDAVDTLDAALSLWRGPVFGDLAEHPAVLATARRLNELRTAAHEARVEALLDAGLASRAVADAEALTTEHPHRERAWVMLVDALVVGGRAADGARAVARARAALAEVGLDPSPALQRAEDRALGIAPHTPAVPPRDAAPMPSTPLMHTPSSFIGRDGQVSELVDLLDRAQIVTLVGPGGVGKTRLAEAVVSRIADRHQHGCRVIELARLTDDDDVATTIVAGLGLVAGDPSSGATLARAGGLDTVLLLDNADHVADDVAHAVEQMTSTGANLRIVVTSRERLGVAGEHVRPVRPLAGDRPDSPAQQLFRDRALAVGAQIDAEADSGLVRRVVERLDGLPLAIEMAAAQLTTCSLPELVDMLDGHAGDLRTADRRAAPRHRSLADLIDWSLDRLPPSDVDALHQLSVFAGWFTVDDIAGVLGAARVPQARRLADRSLVSAVPGSDRTSFAVLHIVREHLHRRFGPLQPEVVAAHASWFLDRARTADAGLATVDEPNARRELHALLDELRAVHRWAVDADRPTALALSATIHRYAQCALNDELLSWADRLLESPARRIVPVEHSREFDVRDPASIGADDDVDDLAVTMASSAMRLINRGEHERGAALARRALALEPSAAAALPLFEAIGDASLYDGRFDDAEQSYRQLSQHARSVGDRWYEAVGDCSEALVAAYSGRPTRPLPDDDPSAPPSSRAWLAYGRAEVLSERDPEAADVLYGHALDLASSVPNRIIEGVVLVSSASIKTRLGRTTDALTAFRAAIEHWLGLADRTHQVTTLRNLVVLFDQLGLAGEAAELIASLDESSVPTYGIEAEHLDQVRARLGDSLAADELRAAFTRGRARDIADAARWALAVIDRMTEDGAQGAPGGRATTINMP